MATIRDVARESGVSVATVSYVLNNGPRPVKAQTRERVLAAIRRLDYHPNAMARGLGGRRMHTIGVAFGTIETTVVTNPYAGSVLQGILSASADADYNVTIFPKSWQSAEVSCGPFRDRRTDGVLVVAPLEGSDIVPTLAALRLPLVVVSSPSEIFGVPFVDVDNPKGAALAIRHLIELGHTRIAHLMGDPTHASVAARKAGFIKTLRDAHVALPPDYLLQGSYAYHRSREAAERLLALSPLPTAVFVGNDMMAFAMIEVARDHGIHVPRDLSVIGFDDVPHAGLVSPPLTTIRQPLPEIGAFATRLLLAQMDGDESPKINGTANVPLAHYLEPTLVVRGTTGPPPP